MKKTFLPLLSIFYASMSLANNALVNVEVSDEPYSIALPTEVIFTSLVDDMRLLDLSINGGQCQVVHPSSKAHGNSFSQIYRMLFVLNAQGRPVSESEISKGMNFSTGRKLQLVTSCHVESINEIILKTTKGIQKVEFNIDVKPVVSVQPLPKNSTVSDIKTEKKPLKTLYSVSNYTCYQDEKAANKVVEYCTPLPVRDVQKFNLPHAKHMTESLFWIRAEEHARRAKYIQFAESFPSELPEFKAKRLPTVNVDLSGNADEKKLGRLEENLLRALKHYERKLLDLIEEKKKLVDNEKKVEQYQKSLERMQDALAKEPSKELEKKIENVESDMLWVLARIENIAKVNIPRAEASLLDSKQQVEQRKAEILKFYDELENSN